METDSTPPTRTDDTPAVHGNGIEAGPAGDGSCASTRPDGLLIQLPTQTEYCCPGETHSIPRSVHLSRLAAFYPACRECQHRSDTGQLPQTTVERIQQVERRVAEKQTVFQQNGIRGVFMNQFTPALAARIARAFAAQLWSELPLTGSLTGTTRRRTTRPGPSIVVGYDERPSSPAVLTAVVEQLRIMGCQVLGVGLVSRPCFAFAVDHLQSPGGIFVTGSGHGASWAGLDLCVEGALPLSLDTGLQALEADVSLPVPRPTRSAGFQRSFQPTLPYEAGLWKHFHALRPLHLVAAVRPRTVRRTLRKLFARLPCRLTEVESETSPAARLKLEALRDRIACRISQRKAHLGILIDDDGSRCEVFNELGERVPQDILSAFLAEIVRSEVPHAGLVLDNSLARENTAHEKSGLNHATQATGSAGATARTMLETKAVLGIERNDRYWFRENYPACDAILALGRLLQGLSQSDAAFSTRLD